MEAQQLVEVLFVGRRRLRVEQLEVPVLIPDPRLQPLHLVRPLQVEGMAVAEDSQVREGLDDGLGDFPGDVRRAKQDQRRDVLKTRRPLKMRKIERQGNQKKII